MATTDATLLREGRAAFRAAADEHGLKGEERKKFLAEGEQKLKTRIAARKQARVDALANAEIEAREEGGTLRGFAGKGVGATLHGLNSALASGLAPLAGALDPRRILEGGDRKPASESETTQKFSDALAASRAVDPITTGVASLGGAFVGPAAQLARGASALPAAALARRLPIPEKAGYLARVAREVATGSAGALAAAGTTEATIGGLESLSTGGQFQDVIDAAIERGVAAATSPTVAAFGGATGVVAGTLRVPEVDRTFMKVLSRVRERAPGARLTPDTLRPDSDVQGMVASISKLPGGRRLAARAWLDGWARPTARVIENWKQKFIGSTDDLAAADKRAARALRAFTGGREDATMRRVDSRLQREYVRVRDEMLGEFGERVVPKHQLQVFMKMWAEELGERRAALFKDLPKGEALVSNMAKLDKAAKVKLRLRTNKNPLVTNPESQVKVKDLFDLKHAMDEFGDAGALVRGGIAGSANAKADERFARRMSMAVSQMMRGMDEGFDASLTTMEKLKAIQRATEPMAKNALKGADIDPLLDGIVKGPGFVGKWREVQRLSTPAEVQAIRGAYFGRFLGKVQTAIQDETSPDYMVKTMSRLFTAKGGEFNKRRFDSMVGKDVRLWLEDFARVDQRVSGGIGAAMGSPTASRFADAIILGKVARVGDMLVGPVQSQSAGGLAGFVNVLGAAGLAQAVRSYMSHGRVADILDRLATAKPVGAPGVTSALVGRESVTNQTDPALGALLEGASR